MAISSVYGGNITVDPVNEVVAIPNHDGSAKGLKLGSTLVTATAAELNIMDGVTASAAELNILDGVTSSAAELNILDGVTATAAELNTAADLSAQTEVVTAGAISVTKRCSTITFPGAGAATLAAPDATMYGFVKIINMSADNGDVTLALTNVQGGSAATTCTFNDVGDTLVLVAGLTKWHVIGESGVTLS